MRTRLAILLLLLAPALAGADPATGAAAVLDRHAPAIVAVDMVLHVKRTGGGGTRESDRRLRANGMLVDAGGLVMLSAAGLAMGRPGGMGERSAEVTPTEIKIRFGGEEKEYHARLVATDGDLGLAFLQIVDLGDRKPAAVEFAADTAISIGQPVVLIGRRDRAYDDAPYCSEQRVNGEITRPRRAWMTDGGKGLAQPVFAADGTPIGVMVRIAPPRGADDGDSGFRFRVAGGGLFLLPSGVVRQRIAAALEEAKRSAAEPAPGAEPGK